MTRPGVVHQNVFQLAKALPSCAAFHRIYTVHQGWPRCVATPELEAKYGVAVENVQHVLSITNRVVGTQCWYNEQRTRKPQNFAAEGGLADPTVGKGCDFCSWQTLTAADTWGRVERQHAVSASNLFKYVAPSQGVVLFKHHNPLEFNLEQLQDLLHVAHGWFRYAAAAATAEGTTELLHPLLVWNCLSRAGASQFHGHAQVMLSGVQYPDQAAQQAAAAAYHAAHGSSYAADLREAHAAVGLLHQLHSDSLSSSLSSSGSNSSGSSADSVAYAIPSLAPWKDAEIIVQGSSMTSPAFQVLLYAALRALIDELGVQTFNAAVSFDEPVTAVAGASGASAGAAGVADGPCTARLVSRGKLSSAASDFGGLEVFGGASIAHTDPFAVGAALDRVLAGLGVHA